MTKAIEAAKFVVNYFGSLSDKRGQVYILNGAWGCGKTYLWENLIRPEIQANNSTTPILYVSCFGAKSVDDVKAAIVREYLALKGKGLLKGEGVKAVQVAQAAKVIGGKALSALQEYAGVSVFDLKLDPISIIEERIFLCLDDLERKASELSIVSLFGFINQMAEGKKASVLVIANESVLGRSVVEDDVSAVDESERRHYHTYKEKVVDGAIKLEADLQEMYDVVAAQYHGAASCLAKLKTSVLSAFRNSGENNIRTLQRVVARIQFLAATGNIELDDRHAKNLVALMIEHGRGKLDKPDSKFDFNPYVNELAKSLNRKRGEEETEALKEEEIFVRTYFDELGEYAFVPEFFDLVLFGACDLSALKQRLNPPEKPQSALAIASDEFLSPEFLFLKDAEVAERIKNAEDLLNNLGPDELAFSVVKMVIGMRLNADRIGQSISDQLISGVKGYLKSRGDAGDDSFDGRNRWHYSNLKSLWEDLVGDYQSALGNWRTLRDKKCLEDILAAGDIMRLHEQLRQDRSVIVNAIVSDETVFRSLWASKPRFAFDLVSAICAEGRHYPEISETLLPKLAEVLTDIKAKSADRMEGVRVDILLDGLKGA